MSVSEEQLAAAIMAKITGNTLKKVDESTLVPVATGPANRVDPMKFISSNNPTINQQQQKEIEERNRQAEMLYPLPQAPQPVVQPQVANTPVVEQNYDSQLFLPLTYDIPAAKAATTELIDTLKAVNNNLSKLTKLFEEWLTR